MRSDLHLKKVICRCKYHRVTAFLSLHFLDNYFHRIDNVLAKRLKRMRRHWSLARSEKDDETDDESNLSDSEVALMAYAVYMKKVIGALMKAASPLNESTDNSENVLNAIKTTIEISRQIYNFVEMAENASKIEDSNGDLSDLVYVKISELQKIVDEDNNLSKGESVLVFESYLTQMLSGIPEAQFEMDNDVILTSNADILYLKLAQKLIRETSSQHLEMFLWWSVVEDLILYTTSDMRQLYYDYSKTITGVDGSVSRLSYCTSSVNKLMGFAVSSLIVEENFMTTTRPKVERMVENIRRSFNNLVYHASWMDWETKERTLKKSQKMKSLIGEKNGTLVWSFPKVSRAGFPEWIVNRTRLELHYKGVS